MANACACGSRTMPPLPTFSRPASNCGFTRITASRSAGAAGNTGPSSKVAEINATSITSNVSSGPAAANAPGLQQPRVGSFHQSNPRIVAQLHRDLAGPGVHRRHVRRAMLQQAVGKATGRGAHVKA